MSYYINKEVADSIVSVFIERMDEVHVAATHIILGENAEIYGHAFLLCNISIPKLKDQGFEHVNVRIGLKASCESQDVEKSYGDFYISNIDISEKEPLALIGFGRSGAQTIRPPTEQSFEVGRRILQAVKSHDEHIRLQKAFCKAANNLVNKNLSLAESAC